MAVAPGSCKGLTHFCRDCEGFFFGAKLPSKARKHQMNDFLKVCKFSLPSAFSFVSSVNVTLIARELLDPLPSEQVRVRVAVDGWEHDYDLGQAYGGHGGCFTVSQLVDG